MEKGERLFIHQARRADIEQFSAETQVFSQVIDLVNQLGENEAFTVQFGTDREAMQSVLDELGVGKIKNPTKTIVHMDQKAGASNPIFGTETIGKLADMFDDLPVTDSVRMIQAESWRIGKYDYDLQTPDRSTSRIFYRTMPDSNLIVAVTCAVTYLPDFPEWDFDYSYSTIKKAENYQKMEMLGGQLTGETTDDRTTLPQQLFAFSLIKTSCLKKIPMVRVLPLPIDVHVSNSIANMRYENGTLTPIPARYPD